MSLSTQLTRGALALPLLLAFASLGLVASQGADAAQVARLAQAASSPALGRLPKLCDAPGRARVLLLAQAPADLGNLVIRWSHSCRA